VAAAIVHAAVMPPIVPLVVIAAAVIATVVLAVRVAVPVTMLRGGMLAVLMVMVMGARQQRSAEHRQGSTGNQQTDPSFHGALLG
jgi:hypothetical protein